MLALQQKSAERRQSGLFVVEGRRELEHCLQAGFTVDTVFYCPSVLQEQAGDASSVLAALPAGTRLFEVSRDIYEKIAYRGSTEGVVAEVVARSLTLGDLQLSDSPLIIVLERVEKPGNRGAVLRSADAARAEGVVICDPLTDLYNPNLIRSSIGAIFTVPCVACSSEECIRFLQDRHIQILTAQLQDSRLYYDTDMRGSTAIVMGTESTGLHGHRHGHRVDGSDRRMAAGSHGSYPHSHARASRLVERLRVGSHPAVRGCAPAADGWVSGETTKIFISDRVARSA